MLKSVGYFADFEQVSYWHKNVISYFAGFKQNKKMLIILWTLNKTKKMLAILLIHTNILSVIVNSTWNRVQLIGLFKDSAWFWTSKPYMSSLLLNQFEHRVVQSETN